MTVNSEVYSNSYFGNGTTSQFVFTFQATRSDWIRATVSGIDAPGTVVLNLDQESNNGGEFTFDTPPGSGEPVTIWRFIPLDQNLDLPDYTPFPARNMEDALDKITMVLSALLNVNVGGDINADVSFLKRLNIGPDGAIYFANTQGSIDPSDTGVYRMGLDFGYLKLSISDGIGNFNPMLTVLDDTVQFLFGAKTPAFPATPDDLTNRNYVDTNLADKVSRQGDTMTGALNVPNEPASGNAAVNKNYVFDLISGIFDGLQFEGFFDASAGTLPTTTENGDFFIIAVGGTLTVSDGLNAPVPTALIKGDKIVYSGVNSWWVGVTTGSSSNTALATSFTPAGNYTANDVQAALEEADNTLFAHASGDVDEQLTGVKTFVNGIEISAAQSSEFFGTSDVANADENYRVVNDDGYSIQVKDGTWRTVYKHTLNDAHIFYDGNGATSAVIGLAGPQMNSEETVATREKGDDRWAKWYATEAQAQGDTSGRIVFADEGS